MTLSVAKMWTLESLTGTQSKNTHEIKIHKASINIIEMYLLRSLIVLMAAGVDDDDVTTEPVSLFQVDGGSSVCNRLLKESEAGATVGTVLS